MLRGRAAAGLLATAMTLAACGGSAKLSSSPPVSTATVKTVTKVVTQTTTAPAPSQPKPKAKPVPPTPKAAPQPKPASPPAAGSPAAVRANFVNACTTTSGGQATTCGCVANKLEQTVSPDQVDSLAADDPRMQSALAACDGASGGGWPSAVRANFVNACTATSGGQATLCGCVADKLEQSVPADHVDSLAADDPRIHAAMSACGA